MLGLFEGLHFKTATEPHCLCKVAERNVHTCRQVRPNTLPQTCLNIRNPKASKSPWQENWFVFVTVIIFSLQQLKSETTTLNLPPCLKIPSIKQKSYSNLPRHLSFFRFASLSRIRLQLSDTSPFSPSHLVFTMWDLVESVSYSNPLSFMYLSGADKLTFRKANSSSVKVNCPRPGTVLPAVLTSHLPWLIILLRWAFTLLMLSSQMHYGDLRGENILKTIISELNLSEDRTYKCCDSNRRCSSIRIMHMCRRLRPSTEKAMCDLGNIGVLMPDPDSQQTSLTESTGFKSDVNNVREPVFTGPSYICYFLFHSSWPADCV